MFQECAIYLMASVVPLTCEPGTLSERAIPVERGIAAAAVPEAAPEERHEDPVERGWDPEKREADPEEAEAGPEERETDPEEADADPEDDSAVYAGPRLATDVAVLGGATGLVAALNPSVRGHITESGSFGNILDNFRNPVRAAVEGADQDVDDFFTNYVSHSLSWGYMGLYLRERGYTRGSAFLFTQLHSIAWEYVIEGSFQPPSGKDLTTNLVSSAVMIFGLYDLIESAAEREDKGLHHHLLSALNPLRGFRGGEPPVDDDEGPTLAVGPVPGAGGGTVGLGLTVRF